MRECLVVPIDGSQCDNDLGGIVRIATILRSNILTVTIAGDLITGMTLVALSHFEEWILNDNNTAQYTESEPTRENGLVIQMVKGQFASVSIAGVALGDGINQCCEGIVSAIEYANGRVRWIGIEYISATDPKWRQSVRKARAFVGTDSGTLESKGFVSLTIDAGAQYLSTFSGPAFGIDAILAL